MTRATEALDEFSSELMPELSWFSLFVSSEYPASEGVLSSGSLLRHKAASPSKRRLRESSAPWILTSVESFLPPVDVQQCGRY